MATKAHMLSSQGIQSHHRLSVMEVIASRQMISVDDLLHALPWMRWSELFSILCVFREEDVVVLDQRGFAFDVRMNVSRGLQGSAPRKSSYCSKVKHFLKASDRQLTRS